MFLKRLLPPVLAVSLSLPAMGQIMERDTAFVTSAIANAKAFYTRSMAEQAQLYNGVAYKGYSSQIDGLPFFGNDWDDGWVVYDAQRYDNIPLLYELVGDKVIVSHYSSHQEMELISRKVESFFVQDHTFIRLGPTVHPALSEGFYDVLHDGGIQLLAKRKKVVDEKIVSGRLEPEFVASTQFFIRKEDDYLSVKSKGSVLRALNEQKAEVKDHLRAIKRSGISFSKNRERAILSAVQFYDESQNQNE